MRTVRPLPASNRRGSAMRAEKISSKSPSRSRQQRRGGRKDTARVSTVGASHHVVETLAVRGVHGRRGVTQVAVERVAPGRDARVQWDQILAGEPTRVHPAPAAAAAAVAAVGAGRGGGLRRVGPDEPAVDSVDRVGGVVYLVRSTPTNGQLSGREDGGRRGSMKS